MENFRNNPKVFVYIAQLFSAGLLVIYLLMLTLDARGQAFTGPVFVQPGKTIHSAHQVALVKKIYTSQIGVREKHNNSGKEVEEYLRYVDLSKGNPWCAAFVCWVYGEAGIVNPRSGWSPALFGEGRIIWGSGVSSIRYQVLRSGGSKSNVHTSGEINGNTSAGRCAYPPLAGGGGGLIPTTADIFGLYFPEKARIAHVGFIDEWKDPWVVTVEGNTNVVGSREGDGVYRKRRLVKTVHRVARYVN